LIKYLYGQEGDDLVIIQDFDGAGEYAVEILSSCGYKRVFSSCLLSECKFYVLDLIGYWLILVFYGF